MAVSPRAVLIKALLLFLACNAAFALLNPLPALGRLSLYNSLFPGRARLPYGERPELAYNLSLFSLEAMFAAHEIAAPKPADEFRVLLIGDSSVWGFLLEPGDTLSGLLNARGLRVADGRAPDGRAVRFYNLGYPTISLTKDLLMLSRGLDYQPDLIIWLVTLESFPQSKQLSSPIVQHNPAAMQTLLGLDPQNPAFVQQKFWDRTIWGQRRALADLLRLQIYGILWAATGVDQVYPENYERPQSDLDADESFHGLQPPTLRAEDLAWNVLETGAALAGDTPLLIVNEPIYLSNGANSDIRYNFFYPRWAYDQYRQQLAEKCAANGWRLLDVWNLIPAAEFTNSAIHLSPAGSQMLADAVAAVVVELVQDLR